LELVVEQLDQELEHQRLQEVVQIRRYLVQILPQSPLKVVVAVVLIQVIV
jgi:hypothetical protein